MQAQIVNLLQDLKQRFGLNRNGWQFSAAATPPSPISDCSMKKQMRDHAQASASGALALGFKPGKLAVNDALAGWASNHVTGSAWKASHAS